MSHLPAMLWPMSAAWQAPLTTWRGPGLAIAGCVITATTLIAPTMPVWVPVVIAISLASVAAVRHSVWALAPLVPLLAVAGGGWWAVSAWTLVALVLPLAWDQWRRSETIDQRDLRDAVRLSRHEIGILKRHLERYPLLLEACTTLSQARNGDELATTLLDIAQRMVPGWSGGAVHLGRGSEPRLIAHSGVSVGNDRELVNYVMQEDRSVVRRKDNALLLVFPLRSERRMAGPDEEGHRGALTVLTRGRGTEDIMVSDLLRALARLGGLGLAAVDLVSRAQALALHDDLTGLFGRHEFFRRLEETLGQARRSHEPIGVIMCDMDHLKKFNDTWGHAAGDNALQAVARAIRDTLPARAAACRYGGEEFGILIPPMYAERTAEIATAVLDAIRRAQPLDDHPEVELTASMGWAIAHQDDTTESLMKRADQACYRAKETGRNRVEAAP